MFGKAGVCEVFSIDLTHFSRLALNATNNLIGRIRHSQSSCPISASSSVSQLVTIGFYKTKTRKSARFMMQ